MASRQQNQLNLPPMHVNKVASSVGDLKNVENGGLTEAFLESGRLIEAARERAGLTRKEACALMFISEPQFSRWVSGAANDTPSFTRLLLLPPSFWFHLNQLLNERFGLRRLIAAQLLGVAADLAIAEGVK